MRRIILICCIVFLAGCEDGFLNVGNEVGNKTLDQEMLIGSWGKQEYHDSLITLQKLNSLPADVYGISFNNDFTLTENKNAGWCGTPPIAYGEFTGSWQLSADSIVTIETTYWGGEMLMEWQIIRIDDKEMTYYLKHSEALTQDYRLSGILQQ